MARPPFPDPAVAQALPLARGRAAWHLAVPALASGAIGAWLALHHPLGPAAALAIFIVASAGFMAYPMAWLWVLPALLPVIDLAPWTGWISFEEVDLLVLAVAAGGYARLAIGAAPRLARSEGGGALIGLGLLLFGASVAWAMARGFTDAGGFAFGWFQGYREPMNSLRLAKAFIGAMLLWPLWRAARRQAPAMAVTRFMAGMSLGLLAVSLAALWERLAFTGLLNFSTDYRTTALFWEMHVGGAALDGFLALTLPFALAELLQARSSRRWLWAAGITLLGLHACLTTFSRGVYLAAPIGAGLTYALHLAQRSREQPGFSAARSLDLVRVLLLALAYAAAAAWMFPSSGYRGILALLGAAALLLPLVTALHGATAGAWPRGVLLGAVLALIAAGGTWLLPKGAYVMYALMAISTFALLALARSKLAGSLAGYIAVLASIGLVCRHWGGEPALWRALPVIGLLFVAAWLGSTRAASPWPAAWRWQVTAACAMGVAGSVVAAFIGGGYMTGRFSTTSEDFAGRRAHWEQGLSMLETTDQQLFGKGLGRYFDNYWLEVPGKLRPGDYRVREEAGNTFLALVAGRHEMGWGELLRISQRVEPPQGPATVAFDVRIAQPAIVHVDLCMKHLLYDLGCLVKQFKFEPANGGGWQSVRAVLDGEPLSRGDWYAPKLAAFSISTETPDVRVEVDNLVLAGADGRNLLVNGDFEQGMARWFFTSDRNHIPWHMKNLWLHLLFEQGWFGLALWCGLVAAAFWRAACGAARGDPLSPAIAGALAGFAVVGLFDSLLDVPRLGLVFYLLIGIALTRRSGPA